MIRVPRLTAVATCAALTLLPVAHAGDALDPRGVYYAEHLDGPFDVIEWFQFNAIDGVHRYVGSDIIAGGAKNATITPDGTLVYDNGGGNGTFSDGDHFTTSFVFPFGTWQTTAVRAPYTDGEFPLELPVALAAGALPSGTFTGTRLEVHPMTGETLVSTTGTFEIDALGQAVRVTDPDGTFHQAILRTPTQAGMRLLEPDAPLARWRAFPGCCASGDLNVLGDVRMPDINSVEITLLQQSRDPVGEQVQTVVRYDLTRAVPLLAGDANGDGDFTRDDLTRWHRAPTDVNGDDLIDANDAAHLAALSGATFDDCNGNHWPDDDETDPVVREDSGELAPVGSGRAQRYRVITREPVTADVTMTIDAAGDLDQAFELLTITLDGAAVATVMQNGEACTPAQETIMIPMATWNDQLRQGAPLIFTVIGNGAVNPFECSEPTWVRLRLDVPIVNPHDVDGDRIPDDCAACPADLDESGSVDFADLVSLLSTWGPCAGCAADFDGDAVVGFLDLIALLAAWGPCATG